MGFPRKGDEPPSLTTWKSSARAAKELADQWSQEGISMAAAQERLIEIALTSLKPEDMV